MLPTKSDFDIIEAFIYGSSTRSKKEISGKSEGLFIGRICFGFVMICWKCKEAVQSMICVSCSTIQPPPPAPHKC